MAANARGRFAKGIQAEKQVELTLRARGMHSLAHRWKTRWGEIDLIMGDGTTLVFVEVKARPTPAAGLYALTPKQYTRIVQAGQWFMAQHPHHTWADQRIDLAVCTPDGAVHHYPDVRLDEVES